MIPRFVDSAWLIIVFLVFSMFLPIAPANSAHAVAQHGVPRYGAGFSNFDYVNLEAPKGGTLVLSNLDYSVSRFDKLNPFSLRGTAAPGLLQLVFETLAIRSADENNVSYGLLAEDIQVATDLRSALFRLNPRARFSDGEPVTAEDVKYAFETLTGLQASPQYRGYFSEIVRAEILDQHTVRFHFARAGADLLHVAGQLPVFSRKWGRDSEGNGPDFERLGFELPIASGPYVIEHTNRNSRIVFRRNPEYWASELPVRRGTYNFDRVVIQLYSDYISQLEAVKAGDIDAFMEMRARSWARMYTGKRIESGELRQGEFTHQNPAGVSAYAFNLRKPKFQDWRVRRALQLAHDYEWINRQVYYSAYQRLDSYFQRSPWSAAGTVADADERALLEPWRDQLPPGVFETVPAAEPADLRSRLREARQLLAEAGWHYRDGALRNASGEPFEIEFFISEKLPIIFVEVYCRALERLGIVVKRRQMQAIEQRQRQQALDFDVVRLSLTGNSVPGGELIDRYGSAAASRPGSPNVAGISSPVVDALIQRVLDSKDPRSFQTAARALDRVLLAGYYTVLLHSSSSYRIAYDHRLAHPEILPRHFSPYDWLLQTWWKDGSQPESPTRQ